MEQIIQKAYKSGYGIFEQKHFTLYSDEVVSYKKEIVLDPLFWQSLGRECGWLKYTRADGCSLNNPDTEHESYKDWKISWMYHALRFHEINLTEGWEKAIKYLEDLIK